MTKIDRANFGSKLGVILASAGSAVGLGNIWRFPYETGNHGGAAFILIYLGCVFLLGLPILIAEFLIGRRSRANTAGAYQKLAPGTHWRWVGRMGVLAAFLILSYYSVVAGWTLEYVYEALTNGFTGKTPTEFISSFQQFSSSPWRPVLWLVLFLLVTHFIIFNYFFYFFWIFYINHYYSPLYLYIKSIIYNFNSPLLFYTNRIFLYKKRALIYSS